MLGLNSIFVSGLNKGPVQDSDTGSKRDQESPMISQPSSFKPFPGVPITVTQTILRHISYIQLWITSLNGQLQFKYVVFHLTMAVFWLFATVKVLDIRKWA